MQYSLIIIGSAIFVFAAAIGFYLFVVNDFGWPTMTRFAATVGGLTLGYYAPNGSEGSASRAWLLADDGRLKSEYGGPPSSPEVTAREE